MTKNSKKSIKPETKVLKSRKSFKKLFKDAKKIFGVTYSDSPKLILDLFEDWDIEYLELIVGNSDDFREDIEDVEVADKLEKLKEEGKLSIYTSNQQIHSKLYIVKGDNSTKFINTSANLTKNAHDAGYQKNYAHIFQIKKGSSWYKRFWADYKEHKNYCDLFLEDLTEKIENSDKDREETIKEWIKGEDVGVSAKERRKVREKLADEAIKDKESKEFVIDTSNLDKSTKNYLKKHLDNLDVEHELKNNRLRGNRKQYRRSIEKEYGIPLMRLKDNKVILSTDEISILTDEPENKELINKYLDNLEGFFELVDRFGETNDAEAVKAHMFEALLYIFYTPFSNYHMEILDEERALGEKGVPFLYIHGESNSGKGTFSKFALGLISNQKVRSSIPANDITNTRIDNLKNIGTSFPLVIDDIDKKGINGINNSLRNYWKKWGSDTRYPPVIMISNDDKPKPWLRNRSKVLDFSVQFQDIPRERSAVNEIIEEENNIYKYFTYILLRMDKEDWLKKDDLYPVRHAFQELYEYAGRDLPSYFPKEPAEIIYDRGREKWLDMFDEGIIDKKYKNDKLILKFNGGMKRYEVSKYFREIPRRYYTIRAEHRGNRIIVKTPQAFKDWIQDSKLGKSKRTGIVSKFKSLVGK